MLPAHQKNKGRTSIRKTPKAPGIRLAYLASCVALGLGLAALPASTNAEQGTGTPTSQTHAQGRCNEILRALINPSTPREVMRPMIEEFITIALTNPCGHSEDIIDFIRGETWSILRRTGPTSFSQSARELILEVVAAQIRDTSNPLREELMCELEAALGHCTHLDTATRAWLMRLCTDLRNDGSESIRNSAALILHIQGGGTIEPY